MMNAVGVGAIRALVTGHVATVTIDRPDKLNALTLAMVEEFRRVTTELDADPEVRVIVITGAGDRVFCVGGDLRSLLPAALEARNDILNPDPTQRFLSTVFTPVIAAIDGACLGGGFEIMLGCDIRVAAEDAVFGVPEGRWGLIPGSGTNVRLPKQVPWAIAMELLLTGATVKATRAHAVGLINEVVPHGQALDRAHEIARQIANNGPLAARTAKEIAVRSASLTDGFVLEHDLNRRILGSADAREGVQAFSERRPTSFTGH
jgi:enoyl-CoA hydratase/carnithine racemase